MCRTHFPCLPQTHTFKTYACPLAHKMGAAPSQGPWLGVGGGYHSSRSATGWRGACRKDSKGQLVGRTGPMASLGSSDATSQGSIGTRDQSQGLLALLSAYSALLSNSVSIPTSVESQHGGSSLTSECSLPEGALQPSNYPESCPFVSHPPCFLLSPDLFSQAFWAACHVEARF